MQDINIYLNFDGNCRQAMTFYEKCLGASLHLIPFSEAPGNIPVDPGSKDRIMHARLSKGPVILMASDTMHGMPFHQGNNFLINIDCENLQETEKLFAALGENGKVIMPLQETFWAARFGMITDQFGVQWMFNLEKARTT